MDWTIDLGGEQEGEVHFPISYNQLIFKQGTTTAQNST